jgi:hypothetical protein
VLWLIGNLIATNIQIKETITNKSSLVKCLLEVFQKNQLTDSELLEVMLWVTSSVSTSTNMSKQVVDSLAQIFQIGLQFKFNFALTTIMNGMYQTALKSPYLMIPIIATTRNIQIIMMCLDSTNSDVFTAAAMVISSFCVIDRKDILLKIVN